MGQKPDERAITFINKVQQKFPLSQAILFGSRARGDHFNNSDYDFIIVSDEFLDVFFSKRIAMMYEFWDFFPIDVEPLCYTNAEFARKKEQIGIVQEAVKEGISLI